MAAGFNSPAILFLNTWDEPERSYLYPVFQKLRAAGYERFVEPCAGAFVMPSICAESGWPTSRMETSDVSLFSALCGYTFMAKPLTDLDIRVDGQPIALERTTVLEQAAEVLYQQLVLRMEQRPERVYWNELRSDILTRRDGHIDAIATVLRKLDKRLHGLEYRPRDVWEHVRSVADDPKTVISVNPPTYKGGFEKFYDTGGRLTWAEPRYELFDAKVDVFRLMEEMQGKAALILCQQQQAPGNAAKAPVYARHLAPGENVYICTNRPEEVVGYAGGLKVKPMKEAPASRLSIPVVPYDHEFGPDDVIEVMPVGGKEATYYRDLWMHKLDFRGAGQYIAVAVNGKLCGMAGYDPSPILRPYSNKWEGALLLTFAVGAPHLQRLTRLITRVALQEQVLARILTPQLFVMVKQVITVELTKHPEAKGLRGLMKLGERVKDKKYGNRLIYTTPMHTDGLEGLVGKWLTKERNWQAARAQDLAARTGVV